MQWEMPVQSNCPINGVIVAAAVVASYSTDIKP